MKSKRLMPSLLVVAVLGLFALAVACAPAAPPPAAPTTGAPGAAPAVAGATPAAGASAFPSKPVLLVVPGTVGGGADVQARAVAAAIEKAKIINQDTAVLNKGGGGAQEPFTFTASKRGDPHYLLATAPLFLTYTLTGQAAYKIEDFTPIANLIWDPSVVVVPAESRFRTLKDVLDAAKASPGTIKFGGGVIGTQDHISLLSLQDVTGTQFNYVSFGGGGELHRAVLAGTVDVANGNPSDFMASIEGGRIRALAILSNQRSTVPALKDVPTAKEQGVDLEWEIFRGWIAPAGISAADVAALEKMLLAVTQDADFKSNYIDKFGMRIGYLNSADFNKRLQDDLVRFKGLLTKYGVIKGS